MGANGGTWDEAMRRVSREASRRVGQLARRVVPATLLTLVLLTGFIAPFAQAGIGLSVAHAASRIPGQGTPNHLDPRSHASSINRVLRTPTASPASAAPGPDDPIRRDVVMDMRPASLVLDPDKSAQFTGSDGVLEVDVPAGTVTAADLAAAGGGMSLEISQIAPASGSNAGGSDIVSFGTYLFQVVDAHGILAQQGLRAPVLLKLHYSSQASAVDLAHAFVVVNGTPPDGIIVAPTSAAAPKRTRGVIGEGTPPPPPITRASLRMGAHFNQPTTFNPAGQTLSASIGMSSPSNSVSWNTDSPVASFGKPDPFNVDLNAGGLTASIPIDVPAGPGGLTPPLALSYSSASVSEQHSPQAAAPWVGEGWNLSLGSISWAEHNVTSDCPPSQPGCTGPTWEDSWQLSDPFGTASELVPPNIGVATYNEDSGNGITASPVQWHAADSPYLKVYSFVSPNALPSGTPNPPCFRVWLLNGIMEEYGCTPDSIQYYPEPSGTPNYGKYYIANWNLDLITDPQGDQIHISYNDDKQTGPDNMTYPRDSELGTVQWDSPTCYGSQAAQTACTTNGTAPNKWAPLMQVNFAASHGVAHVDGPSCGPNGTLRCDDPIDLSGSGGLPAPEIQSTWVLNDIQVQVRSSGTGSWNLVRDYQLGYEQTAYELDYAGTTIKIEDPVTGELESVAGELDLTQVTELGDDSATALPTQTFGYTTETEYYVDDTKRPVTSTNCGPAWNTGYEGSGCPLWSESLPSNSRYMASAINGMGLAQSFSWDNARNNKHGVNGDDGSGDGPNNPNPLYCNTLSASAQATYPCDETDDQNWSHAVLTAEQGQVMRTSSVTVTSTTTYTYTLTYPLAAQECANCKAGMYWGNQNDGDYLDFYDGKYMGFAETDVSNPDGSIEKHKYYATEGYGLYDTSQVTCFATSPCHNAPWWDLGNAAHGHEYETDLYDTNGSSLLRKTTTQYQAVCPPSGVSPSPPARGWGNWDHNLVSELDHNNPVAVCDVRATQTDAYEADGSDPNGGNVPHLTTTYSYDNYGRTSDVTETSNDGGAPGSPTTLVQHTDYIWDDAISATSSGATGRYLIDFPNLTYTRDSGNTTHVDCVYTSYDNQAWAGGQQSGLTLGEATREDHYTNCGTPGNNFGDASGQMTTTQYYDIYGNAVASDDPDANAGASYSSLHLGCTLGGSTEYTSCTAYDPTYSAFVVTSATADGLATTTGYTQSQTFGWGLWPSSVTDPNNQVTNDTYDALGRQASQTLPGDGGLATTSWSYTDFCGSSGPQTPCVEVDQTQRLDSTHTVTTRAFYDGYGRLAETRTPGSNNQDAITYAYYDPTGHRLFLSTPYYVAAYTGAPGVNAYSAPYIYQSGTYYAYDGLDRVTSEADPLSNTTNTFYEALQAQGNGLSDTGWYEQVTVQDANHHAVAQLSDALGRQVYGESFTGKGPWSVYATTSSQYDLRGDVTKVTGYYTGATPSTSVQTTTTYDAVGQKQQMTDADLGTWAYNSYDQNGNLLQYTDARGVAGTVYAGYDGMNRQIWRNTTNSPTGAYVTYRYNGTTSPPGTSTANYGMGRLTGETFAGGPSNSLTGSYSFYYDTRGQAYETDQYAGSTRYATQQSYNDAGQPLVMTYPDGATATVDYDAAGQALDLRSSANSYIISNAVYAANGQLSQLDYGGTPGAPVFSETFSYDNDQRLTTEQATLAGQQTAFYSLALGYDAASNVTQTTTTLPAFGSNPAGTDSQSFCYDELNRLVWAGTNGTPTGPAAGTCGPTPSGTTLSGAGYNASYAYDSLNRMTTGPAGSYTYGDASHLHALTSTSDGHAYAYDASGNATCRAPSSATTCSGTPTGASLSYDNEGRLSHWQTSPTSTTAADDFVYDGSGQRVEQQVTTGGSTTTTLYIGALAEYTLTSGTSWQKYYSFAGRLVADYNGNWHELLQDQLGTAEVQLNANGATTGTAAYDGEGNRVAMQTVTTSAPPPTPGRVTPKGPVGYTSMYHMRNTPNWVSGTGALSAAAMPSPSTVRVSAGSMMPSSHSRAVL